MTPVERRRCEQCEKNRDVKFFSGPRGRVCKTCRRGTSRATARRSHLLKTYGISQEEYGALLAAQGGTCAICGGERPYNLAVDHDHALERELLASGALAALAARGSVRGLLCKAHNKLLREVRDNPQILRAAADYLTCPKAQTVLRTCARDSSSSRQT